jgi:hypothetical protein
VEDLPEQFWQNERLRWAWDALMAGAFKGPLSRGCEKQTSTAEGTELDCELC